MSYYDLTYHLELNQQQEIILQEIYNKVNDEFNYTKSDILDYIIHHPIYYDFIDEKPINQKIVEDIENTTIQGIRYLESNQLKL